MNEAPQPFVRDRKAQELDWRALADALDQEGKHELAEEMRRSGESGEAKKKQAETLSHEQFLASRQTELDQEVAEARNSPRPAHNPRFAAKRLDTATIEAVEALVKTMSTPTNQNRPPSAPNSPKGPNPSGGK